jgi:hypothetical protein
MILSTWNWVVQNSVQSPGEEVLQGIISEILHEMDEQMGFKETPTVAPLETVRRMMEVGWVWGCMITEWDRLTSRSDSVVTISKHSRGEPEKVYMKIQYPWEFNA